jgi:hypothetical protein
MVAGIEIKLTAVIIANIAFFIPTILFYLLSAIKYQVFLFS